MSLCLQGQRLHDVTSGLGPGTESIYRPGALKSFPEEWIALQGDGASSWARIDETFTMAPDPRAIMSGNAWRIVRRLEWSRITLRTAR